MTTKGSFSSAMKTTLRSHMERLVNRLGGLGAGATPR
jgi:hypothetical protein